MRCDFTSTSATSILLYTDIKSIMETVFVSPITGTIGGNNYIKKAYSVGWNNDLIKSGTTVVNIADSTSQGIVLPTLRDETCLAPAVDSTKIMTLTILTSVLSQTLNQDLRSTAIDNGDFNKSGTFWAVPMNTQVIYETYDIKMSEIFTTSWCTTYSTPITIITPGKVLSTGNLC
jgi:hypothetical protein